MRKKLFLVLPFLLLLVSVAGAQTKRALIIAIGNYEPAKTKWSQINVDNDILLIQEALAKQSFPAQNITVLKNEGAKKGGIRKVAG